MRPAGWLFSLMLWTSATVVWFGCALVTAAAFGMMATAWDLCAVLGGLLLLPLPIALAILQYHALVASRRRAIVGSSVLLVLIAGFSLLGSVLTVVSSLDALHRLPWLTLLLPQAGVGCIAGVAAWCQLRRLRQLQANPALMPQKTPLRFSVRDLLAAIGAVCTVAALAVPFVASAPRQFAMGISRSEAPFGLPVDASDISYCHGHRGTIAYEFNTSEAAFIGWVRDGIGSIESDSAGVPLVEITAPEQIRTFRALRLDLTRHGAAKVSVASGLYYRWNKQDRGVYAAFDRSTSRAYYFAHFH